jgi:uncharacterized RDD family membrane protein YckC
MWRHLLQRHPDKPRAAGIGGNLMATDLDLPVHKFESVRTNPAVAVSAPVDKRLVAVILDGVLSAVTLGFGWLVWALVTATSYGQTPGKQLMHLRVVDGRAGIQVEFARMFRLRWLAAGTLLWIVVGLLVAAKAAIVAVLVFIVVVFLPLVHPLKRGFYNLVSATVVVDASKNSCTSEQVSAGPCHDEPCRWGCTGRF